MNFNPNWITAGISVLTLIIVFTMKWNDFRHVGKNVKDIKEKLIPALRKKDEEIIEEQKKQGERISNIEGRLLS